MIINLDKYKYRVVEILAMLDHFLDHDAQICYAHILLLLIQGAEVVNSFKESPAQRKHCFATKTQLCQELIHSFNLAFNELEKNVKDMHTRIMN